MNVNVFRVIQYGIFLITVSNATVQLLLNNWIATINLVVLAVFIIWRDVDTKRF